jgi:ParB/RepB/Spo0J family partition protein
VDRLENIRMDLLNEPPYPMRVAFGDEAFKELCDSIRMKGVLEPLLVRPMNGRYEIMAGHRRYKAAGVCALAEVPCVVRECTDEEAAQVLIHENSGREDVTAAEEGWYYLELVERFKFNEEQLCTCVKKSVPYVNERLDLVRQDADVAQAVAERKINFSVARELLRVTHHTAALVLRCPAAEIPDEKREAFRKHRLYLLDLCVRSGATARVARSYIEQWKASFVPMSPYPAAPSPESREMAAATRMPRCLLCGRDGDPQNMLDLKVHYWEKDGVMRILRSAGIEVYE